MMLPCPQCKTLIASPDADTEGEDTTVTCSHCGNRFDPRFVAAHQKASMIDRLFQETPPAPVSVTIPKRDNPPPPAPPAQTATRRRVRTRNPGATLFWSLASVLLIITLTAQYAWVMRDDLARHAELRPVLEWFCHHAGCEIPLMRTPEQIRIAGRDIRRHPDHDDALLVSISITNQAPHIQAWPVIALRFFDLRDRPLAMRRFTPQEYLPRNIEMATGMPRDTTAQVMLEILDPGPDAVNFKFELM